MVLHLACTFQTEHLPLNGELTLNFLMTRVHAHHSHHVESLHNIALTAHIVTRVEHYALFQASIMWEEKNILLFNA